MDEPIILVNEPYQLSFRYPDWESRRNLDKPNYGLPDTKDGYALITRTYILGKTKDGKIGHVSYKGDIENREKCRHIYTPKDTAKDMTFKIVYEDEGTFGSAGLLHNGNHLTIKLKGFVSAVQELDYHKKYTELMLVGEDKYFNEQEKRMKARLEEMFGGEIPPNVRVMCT